MNNKAIMRQLTDKLKSMYPQFVFNMEYSFITKNYLLSAYRNNRKLKTLVLFPDTDMDSTVELVKEWMGNLVKGLR